MKDKIRKAFFSRKDQTWATPWNIFKRFDEVFNFSLDPCCTTETAKCKIYYTPKEDGLIQEWSKIGNTFVNPPFSRELIKWVKKSYEEANKGIIVALLIPARTDTKVFQDYCFKGKILFIRGRITFGGGSKNPAFFPSALVVFGDIRNVDLNKLNDMGIWK